MTMVFNASQKQLVLAILLALSLANLLTLAVAPPGRSMGGSSFSSGGQLLFLAVLYNVFVFAMLFTCVDYCCCRRHGVLMLQIGLSEKGRSIQRELNAIAKTANTSGFHKILTDTSNALLQDLDYCIAGYLICDIGQTLFQNWKPVYPVIVPARETFPVIPYDAALFSYYIYSCWPAQVMILVAIHGRYTLPVIKSRESLKVALQYLGCSLTVVDIEAVHVLWTPQNEDDALLEEELHKDYPLLKPI
ncbi:unnamed protein product [Ilex paraguariensis]|uniref:Uncharacterized protein n=1 Tax=Ilex paraguariensis TaxID=185542 RepID=A0ABC8SBX0_9AQUA